MTRAWMTCTFFDQCFYQLWWAWLYGKRETDIITKTWRTFNKMSVRRPW